MDSSQHQLMDSPESIVGSSPGGKSRYGRTRRPKVTQDFYHIDSVVIDETPAPPVRSPRIKSPPVKSPVPGREILFEIKDEFTKLDDLGMRVANNFKTNLQRGLDDSIKERKFFKSTPESKVDVANVVDVTKVFKLISNKPSLVSDIYEKKASPKTVLKTYSNKRKHVNISESFVVESFGLPDEPIVPLTNPLTLERDTKIDIDSNIENDVTLSNPWIFDDFENRSMFFSESFEQFETTFTRGNPLDLFYDSLMSENAGIDNTSDTTSCIIDKAKQSGIRGDASQDKLKEVKNGDKRKRVIEKKMKGSSKDTDNISEVRIKSLRSSDATKSDIDVKIQENLKKNESGELEINQNKTKVLKNVNDNIKCDNVDKSESSTSNKKTAIKTADIHLKIDKKKNSEKIENKSSLIEKKSPNPNKKIVEEIEPTKKPNNEQTKNKSFSIVNKKVVEEIKRKLSLPIELPTLKDRKRVLRSKTTESLEDKQDLSITNQKPLKSNKITELISPPPPKEKAKKEVINPKNLTESSEEKQDLPITNQRPLRSNKIIDLISPPPSKDKAKKEVINPQKLSESLDDKQDLSITNQRPLRSNKITDLINPPPPKEKAKKEVINPKNLTESSEEKQDLSITNQRPLRSNKIIDLISPPLKNKSKKEVINPVNLSKSSEEKQDVSITNQKPLRSNKIIISPSPPKDKAKKEVINPANLAKICNSQVRVILDPLACLKHQPQKITEEKSLVPNPFNQKKVKKLKKKTSRTDSDHRRELRSSKANSLDEENKAKNDAEVEIKQETEDDEFDIKYIKDGELDEVIDYSVGDLAWAKLGTHPYWPCVVTPEPFCGYHKKIFYKKYRPVSMYHVRFFGDKGRRSWVSSNKLMVFCGRDDLDNLAKRLKDEKVKTAIINETCIIRPSKLPNWQAGVEEAESLKFKSVDERLDYFFKMFASKRERMQRLKELGIKEELLDPSYEMEGSRSKKRKRLSDGKISETKKPKISSPLKKKAQETVTPGLDSVKKTKTSSPDKKKASEIATNDQDTVKKTKPEYLSPEGRKKIRKISEETPETSKKAKKSDDETQGTPNRIRSPKKTHASAEKKATESEDTFEEKNLQDSEDNQLEDARKKLRNYQHKDDEKRVKKRNSVEDETEENEDSGSKLRNKRHVMPSEYSNSDTDSKFSDNSSVPASLESQAALYRRNNIFRGIPREKVCQICEQPGEVFKCKGPCNGVYHYSCAVYTKTKEDEVIVEKKSIEGKPEEAPVVDVKSNVEIISVNSKKPLPNLSSSPNFKGMSLAEKIDFRMKEIMKKFDYQSVYSESTDSSNEDLILDESFEKIDNRQNKLKNQSKLSLTVTTSPSKKEVPIIKHVTADNINYICVTNEKPKDKEMTELIKDTLKHLRCTWCSTEETPKCLVCGKEESKDSKFRQKCSLHQCGNYYHPECLKTWPQTQWSLIHSTKDKKSDASYDTFVCPRHVCHTCISDDPRAANSRCPSGKVVKCLRCPATYHSSNYCVPAGTHILSSTQIVCPRHYQKSGKKRNFQQTINTNWCFICSKGGDLICCETCPTSVHAECMPGEDLTEDDTFFCEDCQSGRLPLYDEIVWVKLGAFRWWPALILFPNEIPDNVRNVAHNKGEFVVKFFGTYDHYWVGRGRTFLFQEGDKGHKNSVRKRVDTAFIKAIEEAAAAHQLKKQFKNRVVAEKNSGLKPPHYIRIKVNKPVGNVRQFDGNNSNTTSCDCDPHQPHPCGPDSDCLNRLLLTECNPDVCPAADRCNNQCFEKREYPPLIPHHTQERGWGLKTLAPIRKGQFVIEYVGEMIDEQEYQRRVQKMHEQKEENYYFLTIDKDRMLDAGPKGNVARFMNHSCQPNCETQKWTVNGDTRVGLFATCDIPAGTELTFNYNLECIGKEKKICKCGEAVCSGFIGVKVKQAGGPQKKNNTKPKKKKSPPVSEVIITENPCFICGKFGDVGACNNKICTKYYHLECVGLSSWPEGNKWLCQWHNCNICTKRTTRCCIKCINSFCPPHSKGNVRYDKLLGFVCTEHDPIKEINEVDLTKSNSEEFAGTAPTEHMVKEKKREAIQDVIKKKKSETIEDVVKEKRSEEDKDEEFLDSLSLQVRLNGWMTSTPLKQLKQTISKEETSSQPEDTASGANDSKVKKSGKKNIEKKNNNEKGVMNKVPTANTANLFNLSQNEVKLNNFTPVKYLRSTRNSSKELEIADPDKDLPIRKRTRLRCGTL